MNETCAICGCELFRGKGREYASQDVNGRSHGTNHHYVAERFFGRSSNRRGTQRAKIFAECPSGWVERATERFCYECHEVLLHNPVFLPEDIKNFARLVRLHKLSETQKPEHQTLLAGRIELLHEVIKAGLASLLNVAEEAKSKTT